MINTNTLQNRHLSSILALALLTTLGACADLKRPDGLSIAPNQEPVVETPILRAGLYVSESCFLNKGASEGFGANIYTMASLEFDADGIGKNEFALYEDEECAGTPLVEGYLLLELSVEQSFGEVHILKLLQKDPNAADSEEMQILFIASVLDGDDYIMDIDFKNASSGPYLEAPTKNEIASFISDPSNHGVRFMLQD